jgi:hypothetical protein
MGNGILTFMTLKEILPWLVKKARNLLVAMFHTLSGCNLSSHISPAQVSREAM